MDPLTHTLTGLTLGRAGLNRVSAYATPILLLAASAPDIDVITLLWGETNYLHWHRHLTHSFVLLPLLALLPVLVVRLFARKPFLWRRSYLVSLAGIATHPLLDWMNPYGIRFLLPFSKDWYRLDITNLADLWIWGVLIIAALAPLLGKLVSSEIGARPGSGRGFAIAGLCFLALYPWGRYLLHERALTLLDSVLYEGTAPVRVAAVPQAFSPFSWTGLVETSQLYSVHEINLLGQFDPTSGHTLYKPELSPQDTAAAAAARTTESFRVFLEFAQYPYWRFTPADHPQDAIRVECMDLRFGAPPHPRFVASAVVDRAGRVLESTFTFEPPADR